MIRTIDYFAAPQFNTTFDALYKSRLLTGILLAYLGIVVIFLNYLIFLSYLPTFSILLGTLLLLPLAAFYIVSLFILRNKGAYNFAAQCVIASTFGGIISGVFISGGPIDTPAGMIMVLPCILAFCLLGMRSGLCWTIALFLFNLAGISLAFSGYEYPQTTPPEMVEVNRVINWILAFLTIVSIVLIYEHMNIRFKKELHKEKNRYKHMALHDSLTGLGNRKLFHDMLNLSMARASRNDYTVTLLMIDLNGFKLINDTLGHEAGDRVLVHVANKLVSAVRNSDLVVRLGGDEFAVILEGVTNNNDLLVVLDKIHKAIATDVPGLPADTYVTSSIGVAAYPIHSQLEEEIIRFADYAMYFAKKYKTGSKIYTTELEGSMENMNPVKLTY